jgi:peptidoglycan/LPS O-acetylase OafA/YrhL
MNQETRNVFFENLDGLRFIAFLAIFCIHAFVSDSGPVVESGLYQFIKAAVAPCWLGVNFFFCLSGFLITYLLVLEKSRENTIHLRKFYTRRILRIWPLYYALMLFGFVVFPWMQQQVLGAVSHEPASRWMYLAFLSNFDQISNSLPYAPGLVVTWSLAVEEQFYLIWPLLLTIVPLRYFRHLMAGLLLFSLAFRLGFDAHEKHTISCIMDLAVGGLVAVLYFEGSKLVDRVSGLSKSWILLLYSVGIVGLYVHMSTPLNLRLFISLFMGFVIIEQSFGQHSLIKMKNFPTISLLGTWTYGLYILHPIALFVAKNVLDGLPGSGNYPFWNHLLVRPMLAFLLSVAFAFVSYRLLERPFLRIKERYKVIR